MAKQYGFVLISVLWIALLIGVIFSQIGHQARSLLLHWRHLEQQHELKLLGQSLLEQTALPSQIPATCDGWHQSLQPIELAALPWQAHATPKGFPANWITSTAVVCYRHIGKRIWWRKVVRIQMPDWQAVFSQVV